MRTVDREVMTVFIEATDQDPQYCHVTDQEVRSEYYSSTPDGLAEDDGGMDADERLRREAIDTLYDWLDEASMFKEAGDSAETQYDDRDRPIPYPEVRSALQDTRHQRWDGPAGEDPTIDDALE